MIIIDSSCYRTNSNMPQIDSAVTSDILEDITGADLMISKLSIPASKPALVKEHIANCALLAQLKFGADYPSSFGNRLHMSQAKMKEAGASPQQRWLVTIDVFTESSDGELLVNGVPASKYIPGQKYTYHAAVTARRSWQLRGGCYENCYNATQLVNWLQWTDKWLCEKQPEIVYAMPGVQPMDEVDDNDPFQIVHRVSDGRVALAALIGPTMAQTVWEQSGRSTAWAIDFLTDLDDTRRIKGIGNGIKQKARNKLGLTDKEKLEVTLRVESNGSDY